MENTLKQKLAAGARPIGTFFDTASVSLMECLEIQSFAKTSDFHRPLLQTTVPLTLAKLCKSGSGNWI